MSKIIRFIDNNPDGSTELFEAPEEYIAGSLWVNEVDGTGSVQFRGVNDVGGKFFQLSPAPLAGSKLYCVAETEEVSQAATDGLTPWEHANLNKLLEALQEQQLALGAMDNALKNRITRNDFNSWAAIVEQQVKDLKATLLNG
jgi:hypothetical protein